MASAPIRTPRNEDEVDSSIKFNGNEFMSMSLPGEVTPRFIKSTRFVPPAMNVEDASLALASSAALTEVVRVNSKLFIALALHSLLQHSHQRCVVKCRYDKDFHSYPP